MRAERNRRHSEQDIIEAPPNNALHPTAAALSVSGRG
jgi:hypothetical protein